MAEQIEKFDPSTLMQGVKDRIKSTFVSLIPDDKWEVMVQSEISKFFEITDNLNQYHSTGSKISTFTRTVFSVLEEESKRKAIEILNHPDFAIKWEGNSETVSEKIKSMLIAKMPEILAHTMEGMVANVIMNMKNRGY